MTLTELFIIDVFKVESKYRSEMCKYNYFVHNSDNIEAIQDYITQNICSNCNANQCNYCVYYEKLSIN